jgi:hypothetical protein
VTRQSVLSGLTERCRGIMEVLALLRPDFPDPFTRVGENGEWRKPFLDIVTLEVINPETLAGVCVAHQGYIEPLEVVQLAIPLAEMSGKTIEWPEGELRPRAPARRKAAKKKTAKKKAGRKAAAGKTTKAGWTEKDETVKAGGKRKSARGFWKKHRNSAKETPTAMMARLIEKHGSTWKVAKATGIHVSNIIRWCEFLGVSTKSAAAGEKPKRVAGARRTKSAESRLEAATLVATVTDDDITSGKAGAVYKRTWRKLREDGNESPSAMLRRLIAKYGNTAKAGRAHKVSGKLILAPMCRMLGIATEASELTAAPKSGRSKTAEEGQAAPARLGRRQREILHAFGEDKWPELMNRLVAEHKGDSAVANAINDKLDGTDKPITDAHVYNWRKRLKSSVSSGSAGPKESAPKKGRRGPTKTQPGKKVSIPPEDLPEGCGASTQRILTESAFEHGFRFTNLKGLLEKILIACGGDFERMVGMINEEILADKPGVSRVVLSNTMKHYGLLSNS